MSGHKKAKHRVKERLLHWLGLAEARHIAAGKLWYREAHGFAVELSRLYDIPLPSVVGVIAALSPSVYWSANKQQAEALCRAYADGGPLSAVVVTTYGKQAAKARKILETGIVSLGKRPYKTSNFYENILCPDSHGAVTVDQHIVTAAGFTEFWVCGAKWCYDLIANALQEIAAQQGLLPCEVQAIIWLTYKDLTDSKSPVERVEEEPPF